MKNNRRCDLSSKLTHFFRMLDLDDGSAPSIPEYWGDNNITEITEHTQFWALFLLRHAIRRSRHPTHIGRWDRRAQRVITFLSMARDSFKTAVRPYE